MEEQVISRAHRMGATRPIQVETLAMRGTIEEQMLKLLQVCGHNMFMTLFMLNYSQIQQMFVFSLSAGF